MTTIDQTWPRNYKWGYATEEGHATVFEVKGGRDGRPTHRAELRRQWGRDAHGGGGDILGAAQYVPPEVHLDGTVVAPGYVMVQTYYGKQLPPPIRERLQAMYPKAEIRESAEVTSVDPRNRWALAKRQAGQTPGQVERLMAELGLPPDQSEVVHQWPDGWTIRKLRNSGDKAREGYAMNHCWAPYDGPTEECARNIAEYEQLDAPVEDHYSLRDPNNIPKASFYYSAPGEKNTAEGWGQGVHNLTEGWSGYNESFGGPHGYGMLPDPGDEGWDDAMDTPEWWAARPVPAEPHHVVFEAYGHGDSAVKPEYRNRIDDWLRTMGGPAYEGAYSGDHDTSYYFRRIAADSWGLEDAPEQEEEPVYKWVYSAQDGFIIWLADNANDGRPYHHDQIANEWGRKLLKGEDVLGYAVLTPTSVEVESYSPRADLKMAQIVRGELKKIPELAGREIEIGWGTDPGAALPPVPRDPKAELTRAARWANGQWRMDEAEPSRQTHKFVYNPDTGEVILWEDLDEPHDLVSPWERHIPGVVYDGTDPRVIEYDSDDANEVVDAERAVAAELAQSGHQSAPLEHRGSRGTVLSRLASRAREWLSGAALSPADLKCPVTGKSAYADEATAMKWIERAWRSPDWVNKHGQMPTRAYECPECGWWHMTSKPERTAAEVVPSGWDLDWTADESDKNWHTRWTMRRPWIYDSGEDRLYLGNPAQFHADLVDEHELWSDDFPGNAQPTYAYGSLYTSEDGTKGYNALHRHQWGRPHPELEAQAAATAKAVTGFDLVPERPADDTDVGAAWHLAADAWGMEDINWDIPEEEPPVAYKIVRNRETGEDTWATIDGPGAEPYDPHHEGLIDRALGNTSYRTPTAWDWKDWVPGMASVWQNPGKEPNFVVWAPEWQADAEFLRDIEAEVRRRHPEIPPHQGQLQTEDRGGVFKLASAWNVVRPESREAEGPWTKADPERWGGRSPLLLDPDTRTIALGWPGQHHEDIAHLVGPLAWDGGIETRYQGGPVFVGYKGDWYKNEVQPSMFEALRPHVGDLRTPEQSNWDLKLAQTGAELDGAMVALFVPPNAAQQLAVPGGEPADLLHVTLVFFEQKAADRQDWGRLTSVLRDLAGAEQAPGATATELGSFPAPDKGGVVWAKPEFTTDVAAFRERVVQAVEAAGFPVDKRFPDWKPHITLMYGTEDPKSLNLKMPVELGVIPSLSFNVGGVRSDFPFGMGGWHMANVEDEEEGARAFVYDPGAGRLYMAETNDTLPNRGYDVYHYHILQNQMGEPKRPDLSYPPQYLYGSTLPDGTYTLYGGYDSGYGPMALEMEDFSHLEEKLLEQTGTPYRQAEDTGWELTAGWAMARTSAAEWDVRVAETLDSIYGEEGYPDDSGTLEFWYARRPIIWNSEVGRAWVGQPGHHHGDLTEEFSLSGRGVDGILAPTKDGGYQLVGLYGAPVPPFLAEAVEEAIGEPVALLGGMDQWRGWELEAKTAYKSWKTEYNYREAVEGAKLTCATCTAFKDGKCRMFYNAKVEANWTCDEWSDTWRPKTAAGLELGDLEQFVLDMLDQPENDAVLKRAYQIIDEEFEKPDAAQGYLGYNLYRMIHETIRHKFPPDFDWVQTDYSKVARKLIQRMMADVSSQLGPNRGRDPRMPEWVPTGGGAHQNFDRATQPMPEYDPSSGWTYADWVNWHEPVTFDFKDANGRVIQVGDTIWFTLIDDKMEFPWGYTAKVLDISPEAGALYIQWVARGAGWNNAKNEPLPAETEGKKELIPAFEAPNWTVVDMPFAPTMDRPS